MLTSVDPPLDGAVVLLEHVVQIWHRSMPAILGKSAFGFELRDGGRIRGVAVGVDHSRRRMVCSAERFGKKALGCGRVLLGGEKEVEGGAAGIHRPVEITPLAFYPDVGLVHTPDLKKYYNEDELKAYFPRIIENNTVGGKLVSIPLYTDAGILYYRTDLLEKYGYKEPPKTWEELAAMAKKIQDGERAAGKPDFQGFVSEGRASESVTCNALEWIYSYGGGSVIEPDKKVTINNPNAIKALDTAHSWIGTISPAQVTTYDEEEARKIWQAGNAAFMRNWPYAYGLGADPKSSAVSGKFDVTVLPKGGDNGNNAACLGGHQLMISAYSKAPDAAADLVRYLSSAEVQKKRAIDWSVLPTRSALYSDPDVLAKYPFFKTMLDGFNNAVARPSTVTGADYNQLSTAFSQNVNKVLTGAESGKDAVDQVERVAKSIVH
jgi:trehalose/maltose transport system substrate-binding protein